MGSHAPDPSLEGEVAGVNIPSVSTPTDLRWISRRLSPDAANLSGYPGQKRVVGRLQETSEPESGQRTGVEGIECIGCPARGATAKTRASSDGKRSLIRTTINQQ